MSSSNVPLRNSIVYLLNSIKIDYRTPDSARFLNSQFSLSYLCVYQTQRVVTVPNLIKFISTFSFKLISTIPAIKTRTNNNKATYRLLTINYHKQNQNSLTLQSSADLSNAIIRIGALSKGGDLHTTPRSKCWWWWWLFQHPIH